MTEDQFNALFDGLDLFDYQKDALRWRINELLSASIADTAGASEHPAFKLLAALIDIYDDGHNNAPEHRCYVEGAWGETLAEARAYLAAPPAPSVADAAGASEPFGWVQPKGGNYFTRSETTAKRIGGLVPVYLGTKEGK